MIRGACTVLRRAIARRLPALACAVLAVAAAACGGGKAAPAPGQVAPAVSVAPMDLGGQRVLILPVQASAGLQFTREDVTRELVAALRGRDTRTQWIDPARLRRSLAASPNFAPDPAALPNDRYEVYGERRVQGGLADALRRYMALTEARLVVVPRSAVLVEREGAPSFVRMSAALVDARTGLLVWWGEADGAPVAADDRALIASAAEAMAARMVIADSR